MESQPLVVVIGRRATAAVVASGLAASGYRVLLLEEESASHPPESIGRPEVEALRSYLLSDDGFRGSNGVCVVGPEAAMAFTIPSSPAHAQPSLEQMLAQAIEAGVTRVSGTIESICRDQDRVTGLVYRTTEDPSQTVELVTQFVVDTSGVLVRAGVAGERRVEPGSGYHSSYAVCENIRRDPERRGEPVQVFQAGEKMWARLVTLTATRTGVEIVVPADPNQPKPDALELLEWGLAHLHPDLTARTRQVSVVRPPLLITGDAYHFEKSAGDGWLCVGRAHHHMKSPLTSGLNSELFEAQAAVESILSSRGQKSPSDALTAYQKSCHSRHEAALDVIQYFWHWPAFFANLLRGAHRPDLIRLIQGGGSVEPSCATCSRRNSRRPCCSALVEIRRSLSEQRDSSGWHGDLRSVSELTA